MSENSDIFSSKRPDSNLVAEGITAQSKTKNMFSGTDPDQLSEILSTPGSRISVAAQDNSHVAFRCNFLSAGPISVAECSYEGTLALKREAPSEKMILFMPTQGGAIFNYPQKPIESAPGYCTILEGDPSIGSHLFGPRHHMALFIDKPKIIGSLTHMLDRTIKGKINIHPHVDLTSNTGQALQHLTKQLYHGIDDHGVLKQSPLALASLCDAVIFLILENCEHRYSEELARSAPSPAPRHVKRAIDFMQQHISTPISLSDIADIANVSIRTLQQGFRQFKNTTPMAHLLEMRMVAAHSELRDPYSTSTVSQIAAKWGFTHLGRFAAEYKKRFGHLPSQASQA
jgi:AraC-like DNA-binding protein